MSISGHRGKRRCSSSSTSSSEPKRARIFSPHKVKVMQPTAADVDSLAVIPFLNQQEVLMHAVCPSCDDQLKIEVHKGYNNHIFKVFLLFARSLLYKGI